MSHHFGHHSDNDAKRDALASLEIFRHCTTDELDVLAQVSTRLDLPAGQVLCRQGDIGFEFFVIAEGEVAVGVDGHRVATLGRGNFVGEQSLLEHSRRNATVTALTPLSVYVFNLGEFSVLLHDAPHAAADMLIEVSHRANLAARKA
jgi:CRP-like cAMP-binding protein